jgi:hypothetical protein
MHHSISRTGAKSLMLKAAWDPAQVKDYIKKHDITSIFYSEELDEKADMGTVLEPYSNMKELLVICYRAQEWSFLQSFVHLKTITLLVPGHASIDLSACKQLSYACVPWDDGIEFHSLPNLKTLSLWDYAGVNLEPFVALPNLEHLVFFRANLQSLYGIGKFSGLQTLTLSLCRRLKRISALNELLHLQELSINGSSRVKDYAQLANLPALERIRLDFCGDIPSITFLRKLKSLKYVRLAGNTRVMDKNTVPLEEIAAAFYDRATLKTIWGPRK